MTLSTAVEDGVDRCAGGLRVVAYSIPEGCIASNYPECNPLLPLWHHKEKGKVPAAKPIPVRVIADTLAITCTEAAATVCWGVSRLAGRDLPGGSVQDTEFLRISL